MKAQEELGWGKSFRYVFFSFIQLFYPFFFLPPLRKLYLAFLGSKIGNDSIILNSKFFNLHRQGFSHLTIGNECFIGDESLFDLYDQIILEDQVTIAQRVTILTHLNVGYSNHPLQKYFPKYSKPTILKKGCVIAAGALILPGVTVGKESFVAAGSIVTKSIDDRTLVGGNPARKIRKIE